MKADASSSGEAVLASLLKPHVDDTGWRWRLFPAHAVLGAACLYCFREFGGSSFLARLTLAGLATALLAMMPLRAGLRAQKHMQEARTIISCFFYGWLNCLLASAILMDEIHLGALLLVGILGLVFALPSSLAFAILQATTIALLKRLAPSEAHAGAAAWPRRRHPSSSGALWFVSGLHAALSAIAACIAMWMAMPGTDALHRRTDPLVIEWTIAALALWAAVQFIVAFALHARRRRQLRAFRNGAHEGFRVLPRADAEELFGEGLRLADLPQLTRPTPEHAPAHVLLRADTPVGEGAYREARIERPVAVF